MTYTITDFGAVGDGTTLNTAAIQNAIDTCTASGGGRFDLRNPLLFRTPADDLAG